MTQELRSAPDQRLAMRREMPSPAGQPDGVAADLRFIDGERVDPLASRIEELELIACDLRNLLDSTQIALVSLGRDLRIKHFTSAARDVIDLTECDRGRAIDEVRPRLGAVGLADAARQVLRQRAPVERELHLRDGRTLIMRILPLRSAQHHPDRGIDGCVLTFVDVSGVKSVASEARSLASDLEARVDELETLLELIPTGVGVTYSTCCDPIHLNRRARELLGLGRTIAPVGSSNPGYRVFRGDQEIPPEQLPLQQCIATGTRVDSIECRIVFEGGRAIDALLAAMPLFDEHHRVRGGIIAFEDVSAVKRSQAEAEARAAQHDAVAALGNLGLRGVPSHTLLQTAVDLVCSVLACDFAKALQLDDDREALTLVAGRGWHGVEIGRTKVPNNDASQGGYTLRSSEPVVVEDLPNERRFQGPELLTEHGVISGLSVIIGEVESPWGVLGVHHAAARSFSAHDVSFVQSVANVIANRLRSERASQRQAMLLNELQHRVKNTLAVVQSICAHSMRKPEPATVLSKDFQRRLHALARAHTLLTEHNWSGVWLRELVESEARVYAPLTEQRFVIDGPENVRLPTEAGLALAMALHELATNAAKYGALSNAGGRVAIAWRVVSAGNDRNLVLTWCEQDGPPVTPPAAESFGLDLIRRGLAHGTGAEVTLAFRPEGLSCKVQMPLELQPS